MDKLHSVESAGANLTRGGGINDALFADGVYQVECRGADGEVKWTETIHNLVTTVGKNLILDTILAGSAFTASVYMGLKGTGSANAADTQASHAGWNEVGGSNAPTFTGNRQTPSFSAASAGAKATSSAVSFSITGTGTVAGCFININGSATKDNTTGTLLSAGDFSGGSRSVISGDTISVTYTLSV